MQHRVALKSADEGTDRAFLGTLGQTVNSVQLADALEAETVLPCVVMSGTHRRGTRANTSCMFRTRSPQPL